MRLNKSTSYAVRILIDCAKAGDRLIKVADIAQRLDITQQNAFKIVHLLSRAGFLASVRGRNGGVRLARPATKIRIGDVVRAIEFTRIDDKTQPGSNGSLSQIVDDALEAFITVLDQHTLAEMAKAGQGVPETGSGGRSPGKALRAGPPGTRVRRGSQQAVAR